jgi:hypothetical protein
MLRRTALIIFASALTLAAFQFTGQKKDKGRDPNFRNVQGQVYLPDGEPANGAVVQMKNLKTLEVRSYITQKEGRYQFQHLSTRADFEFSATYQKLASPKRKVSVFDTRLDAIVDLKLDDPSKPAEKDPQ